MYTNICCFSGHRRIPRSAEGPLKVLLRHTVRQLAGEGYRCFVCGGALGFDTLAAEAVLEVRRSLPEITLSLALPCPEQSGHWSEADRQRYGRIRALADEETLVSPVYSSFCMQKRNRFMVDHSSLLVCYQTQPRGGTASTVAYALQQGLRVINLADQLQSI